MGDTVVVPPLPRAGGVASVLLRSPPRLFGGFGSSDDDRGLPLWVTPAGISGLLSVKSSRCVCSRNVKPFYIRAQGKVTNDRHIGNRSIKIMVIVRIGDKNNIDNNNKG